MLISSDLSWGSHCNYIIKKANRRLYALRQLKRSGVAACDIISVYCALVRPILEYASSIGVQGYPEHCALIGLEFMQMRFFDID